MNYKQIPVNAPRARTHPYSFAGAERHVNALDPVYAPNSKGGTSADPERYRDRYGEPPSWYADGEILRSAYVPHQEDTDEVQARAMMLEVWNDGERDRFVENVSGHLSAGVGEDILVKAFDYWKSIDQGMGERVEVRTRQLRG